MINNYLPYTLKLKQLMHQALANPDVCWLTAVTSVPPCSMFFYFFIVSYPLNHKICKNGGSVSVNYDSSSSEPCESAVVLRLVEWHFADEPYLCAVVLSEIYEFSFVFKVDKCLSKSRLDCLTTDLKCNPVLSVWILLKIQQVSCNKNQKKRACSMSV